MSRKRKTPIVCNSCQIAGAVKAGHTVYRPSENSPLMKQDAAVQHLARKCRCPHKAKPVNGQPVLGFDDPHELEGTLF